MAKQPKQTSREALIGVGLAGVLAGILTAAVIEDGPRAATTPLGQASVGAPVSAAEQAAEAEDPSGLGDLLDALEEAHEALAESRQDQPKSRRGTELPPRLRAAINADEWLAELRTEAHRTAGQGTFATEQGLTRLGQAVVERVNALPDHGIDTKEYGLPALNRQVEDFTSQVAGGAVKPPPAAGPAGRVLVDLLAAPRFDRVAAGKLLEATAGEPTADHVEDIAERLADAGVSKSMSRAIDRLEASIGKALTLLVLDFRFIRRVGPFELRSAKKVARKKRSRAELLADLADLMRTSVDPGAALDRLAPRHPTYQPLMEVYAQYRGLAEAGGCATDLDVGWKIRPGASGASVERVQKRLACEGYYDGPIDGTYGDALLAAVGDYQRHHELEDEGFVFEKTLRSMNVPMARRAEQIALALQRARESKAVELGDYYIRVNVPAFELQIVEENVVTGRQTTIVGTNRLDDDKVKLTQGHINRTKLFVTELYEVIANPDWILPRRVEKGELKAKLATDPDYLAKNNIIAQTLDNGTTVYIQRSGEGNVLGKVKFLLRESSAIFLHDTNDRSLFRHLRRDLSHGCIRVHKALSFAQWILEKDGWDAREVERSLGADTVQRGMKLKSPVPLVTEYATVDIAADGKPVFLTDIYGYDKAVEKGTLPPQVTARWGSAVLRPNWVPRVPEEVVNGWRAAGRHAPHNYEP